MDNIESRLTALEDAVRALAGPEYTPVVNTEIVAMLDAARIAEGTIPPVQAAPEICPHCRREWCPRDEGYHGKADCLVARGERLET